MKIQESVLFSALNDTIKNILAKDMPFHYDSMENKTTETITSPGPSDVTSLEQLTKMGFLGYSIPLLKGGTELGERVTSMICEEVGNYLFNYPYVNAITTADLLLNSTENYDKEVKAIAEGDLTLGYVHFANSFLKVEEKHGQLWVTSSKKVFVTHFEKLDKIVIRLNDSFYLVSKFKYGLEWSQERSIGEISCYTLSLKKLQLEADERINVHSHSLTLLNSRLRLRQASYLIGLAKGALNQGIKYVNLRKQFDKKLIDNQTISFKLASLLAQLNGAEHKIRATATKAERNIDISVEATQALALASELALETSRECLHYHGAFGMTQYSLIEKYFKLISIESVKYGVPNDLWLKAGEAIVDSRKEKTELEGERHESYNEAQTVTN